MRAVRILGIDPGTVTVGFGCLEVADAASPPSARGALAPGARPIAHRASNVIAAASGGRLDARVVDVGVVRLGQADAIEVRLGRLADAVAALLRRLRPDHVALESAFAGKSVQSALRIGEARGVVLAEVRRRGVSVEQLTPARVKRCLTGHGAASKEAVARMTGQLLGLREPPSPHDASDALAVAYASAEQRFSLARRAAVGR